MLFGATGDLAKRKLLPGLYHLFVAGLLPEKFRDHRDLAAGVRSVRRRLRRARGGGLDQFGNTKPTGPEWDEFASRLSFGAASTDDTSPLVSAVEAAEKAISGGIGGPTSGGCSTWRCRRPRSAP